MYTVYIFSQVRYFYTLRKTYICCLLLNIHIQQERAESVGMILYFSSFSTTGCTVSESGEELNCVTNLHPMIVHGTDQEMLLQMVCAYHQR